MSHVDLDCRTPGLALRASLVPLLCGNLIEVLRSDGIGIPGRIKDYLIEASADFGSANPEQWELLHVEYLREVFGVFGDTSRVISEDALLAMDFSSHPYVSSLFQLNRKDLRASILAGGHLRDLPRWKWMLDPFLAAHWRLVQAADRLVVSKYQEFLMTLSAVKLDDLHRDFLVSTGLGSLSDTRDASGVRASIESIFDENDLIRLDSRRCTRSCLVLSTAVSEQLDLVLVLDELRGPASGQNGRFRPFIRLINVQAKHMAGASAEGVVLQVPINELVPGAHIYGQLSSPHEFAIGIAFNVRLFELLVPAFVAAINNELPTEATRASGPQESGL
jgi:hypothetical protein